MSAITSFLTETNVDATQLRKMLAMLKESDVFKLGSFKLKSGIESSIYIDLRALFSSPTVLKAASDSFLSKINSDGTQFDKIVGVPYAALPVATLLSVSLNKGMLVKRKEAKSYGTKKLIEGEYKEGHRALIIEDVVTSGASIIEVVETLRAEGLVVEDVYCFLDRQQGGADRLAEFGIRLHSVICMEQVLAYLFAVGALSIEKWREINTQLSLGFTVEPTVSQLPKTGARQSLEVIGSTSQNVLTQRLTKIMLTKKTNLCVAIDYTSTQQVLELARKIAPFVCAIKIHADILVDFSDNFTEQLVALAKEHDVVIFEDRKFGDTGSVVHQQALGPLKVAKWADCVTVHAVAGPGIVQAFEKAINSPENRLKGFIVVAEMSSQGTLSKGDYTKRALEIAAGATTICCGVVAQNRNTDKGEFFGNGLLLWSPGVHRQQKNDAFDQQWRSIEQAVIHDGADIVIVGRGISGAENPADEAQNYREEAWKAFQIALGQ